jgi:hypothetical protein
MLRYPKADVCPYLASVVVGVSAQTIPYYCVCAPFELGYSPLLTVILLFGLTGHY